MLFPGRREKRERVPELLNQSRRSRVTVQSGFHMVRPVTLIDIEHGGRIGEHLGCIDNSSKNRKGGSAFTPATSEEMAIESKKHPASKGSQLRIDAGRSKGSKFGGMRKLVTTP